MRVEPVRPEEGWNGVRGSAVGESARLVAQTVARDGTLVIRGRAEILALRPMLMELATISGQAGGADDLEHFMGIPGAIKKTPYLVLHRAVRGERSVWGINGATLLFECPGPLGGSRVFVTTDDAGRRNVLAAEDLRAQVAVHAAQTMVEWGAQAVLIDFSLREQEFAQARATEMMADVWRRSQVPDAGRGPVWPRKIRAVWAHSERTLARYLRLERSYEDTVARMSHKMRFNLGYHRRRAERELGSEFVPNARVSLESFLELNGASMFAVPAPIAEWRFHSLKRISDPVLCGVRDGAGRWLSLLGGRRQGSALEIDWVMNREGLARFSLGTVVRSYVIESECGRGTERVYVEGGTPHGTGRWFEEDCVKRLVVKRRSAYVWLLTRFATLLLGKRHHVSQAFDHPDLKWQRW